MSYLRSVARAKWIRASWPAWVPAGDVPADSVSELKATDNRLSVYRATTQDEIETAVAGIASRRHRLANLDYILIPTETLSVAELKATEIAGETNSTAANLLHYDIVEIYGLNLLLLAVAMADTLTPVRVRERRVGDLLRDRIKAGDIDPLTLTVTLAADLGL